MSLWTSWSTPLTKVHGEFVDRGIERIKRHWLVGRDGTQHTAHCAIMMWEEMKEKNAGNPGLYMND